MACAEDGAAEQPRSCCFAGSVFALGGLELLSRVLRCLVGRNLQGHASLFSLSWISAAWASETGLAVAELALAGMLRKSPHRSRAARLPKHKV